jgi:DtxR family Mn-dependent transcriptional regulator
MPSQITRVASDDALTAIYRIGHDDDAPVIAARIAERLEISAPSMGAMLRRLERMGLIQVQGNRRVTLTAEGLERAELLIRRHRLVECFLIDELGLEWWRAYDEAHLMEHAISSVTEPLLSERLGHPTVSPFGYPIPGLGSGRPMSRRTVADMGVGEAALVERVYEEDADLVQYFDGEGIRPNVTLRLQARSHVRGIDTVEVDGREVEFASHVARKIWVEPRGT